MKVRLFYVILAFMFALVPSVAAAETTPERVPERHCAIRIDPIEPGEKDSKVYDFRCFNTFAEAIASATDGVVQLPASTRTQKLPAETFAGTLSSFVVGIDYQDSNFSGDTLVWTAPSPCSPTVSYGTPTMPSGWNDKVSSAQAYSDCNFWWHFEHTNYSGSQYLCTCSSMSAMNDKTSSETWSY